MSQSDFEAMWQFYKYTKNKYKERNTLLLVDMMEADGDFYMTKEIWKEFKEILRDYCNYQYEANPKKQKQRDESWMFWRYFQHHIKRGLGIGEAKQRIADEFGWTFDRVDKVINRKWDKVFAEHGEQYEATWQSLQDKS